MKPHKHAEIIKAWADGAEIEYLWADKKWMPIPENPTWPSGSTYRIKPEPKPDVVIYLGQELSGIWFESNARIGRSILAITRCGETGALKSAEVLK